MTTLTAAEEAAFLSRYAGAVPSSGAPWRQALGELVASAREHEPALPFSGVSFAQYLGERVPASFAEDPVATLRRLSVSGLRLAHACSEGHPAALDRLSAEVRAALPAARSVDSRPELLEEVWLKTLEELIVGTQSSPPKILRYAGAGSLSRWLRAVVVGTAVNRVRARGELQQLPDEQLAELSSGADVELAYLKGRHAGAFGDAFRSALRELPSSESNALRMHFLDGLTLEQIAAFHRVHRSTIIRWLAQARARLLGRTRQLLEQALGLTTSQGRELVRLLTSGLDVSLRRYLRGSQ